MGELFLLNEQNEGIYRTQEKGYLGKIIEIICVFKKIGNVNKTLPRKITMHNTKPQQHKEK